MPLERSSGTPTLLFSRHSVHGVPLTIHQNHRSRQTTQPPRLLDNTRHRPWTCGCPYAPDAAFVGGHKSKIDERCPVIAPARRQGDRVTWTCGCLYTLNEAFVAHHESKIDAALARVRACAASK